MSALTVPNTIPIHFTVKMLSGDLVTLSLSPLTPCSEVYHFVHLELRRFRSTPLSHWMLTLFRSDGSVLSDDYHSLMPLSEGDVLTAFYELFPFRVRFEYVGIAQDGEEVEHMARPFLCYDLVITSYDEVIFTERYYIRMLTAHQFITVIYSSPHVVVLSSDNHRIHFTYSENAVPLSDPSLMFRHLFDHPYFSLHSAYRSGALSNAFQSAYDTIVDVYPVAQDMPNELPPLDYLL
jgi:hypothetical protein